MRIGIDIDNTMCGTDEIIDTKIEEYIKKSEYYLNCYEMEQNLNYVSLPETAVNDACEMEHAVSKESFEALKRVFGICEFQFVSLAGVLAGL